MNNITQRPCAHCGQTITLTNTASLTRPDGTSWPIYHGTCWETHNAKET